MNKILLLVFVFVSRLSYAQEQRSPIQFNGLYETECELEDDDDERSKCYLRFYPNGKVISITTYCEGSVSQVQEWFNLENTGFVSVGSYYIKGNRLWFSTSSQMGTVKYNGRIDKTGLITLKVKSLINGYKGKEQYKFVLP